MKKFFSGFLTCAFIIGLSISAIAISGRMTIDVDPINIQVNGETFVPKDVNGAEVPVFAYQGTTYAPLRALAEAYGLTVGYDAEKNMATVQNNSQDMNTTYSDPAHDEGMNADDGPGVSLPDETKAAFGDETDYYDDLYQRVMSETNDKEYGAFKLLWSVSLTGRSVDDSGSHARYSAVCTDDSVNPSNPSYEMCQMMTRLAYEYRGDDDTVIIEFSGQGYGYYCTIGF